MCHLTIFLWCLIVFICCCFCPMSCVISCDCEHEAELPLNENVSWLLPVCFPLPPGHWRPQSFSLLGWASHQSHLWHHSDSPQGPGCLVKHGTCHVFVPHSENVRTLRRWVTLLSSFLVSGVCVCPLLCRLFIAYITESHCILYL